MLDLVLVLTLEEEDEVAKVSSQRLALLESALIMLIMHLMDFRMLLLYL